MPACAAHCDTAAELAAVASGIAGNIRDTASAVTAFSRVGRVVTVGTGATGGAIIRGRYAAATTTTTGTVGAAYPTAAAAARAALAGGGSTTAAVVVRYFADRWVVCSQDEAQHRARSGYATGH